MAVNELIPRAQPKGEIRLRCHNSLVTSESLIIYNIIFTTDCLGYAFST